jgi:hypothetical protein
LALFLALGGISYAAVKLPANSVGTKQLKRNAVVSSKVKNRTLAAADFKKGQLPAGPRGAKGPTGGDGPQGPQGAPGATTSVLTGRSALAGVDSFFVPTGVSVAGAEGSASILSPGVPSTAGNLSVRLDVAPGAGSSRVITLWVNGADSALTCTIPAAGTTCSNSSASVAVPVGTRLSLQNHVVGAAAAATGVQFGLTLQP